MFFLLTLSFTSTKTDLSIAATDSGDESEDQILDEDEEEGEVKPASDDKGNKDEEGMPAPEKPKAEKAIKSSEEVKNSLEFNKERDTESFNNLIKEKLRIKEQATTNTERLGQYRQLTQQNYNLIKEKFEIIRNLNCENKDTEYLMKKLVIKEAQMNKAVEHQYFILEIIQKKIDELFSGFGGSEYDDELQEIETELESVEYNIDSYSLLFKSLAEEKGCNGELDEDTLAQITLSKEYLDDSVEKLTSNKEELVDLLRSVK